MIGGGIYETVAHPEPIKRYVNTAFGVDDECKFPNLVYRGWCKDPATGDQWQTHYVHWDKDLMWRQFTAYERRRIETLRWSYQQGTYQEANDARVELPGVGDDGDGGRRAADSRCSGSRIPEDGQWEPERRA